MSRRSSFASTSQSWQSQNWPTRIIRFWLGATWIYGGWVKASDPGFLTKGSSTYIGTQIAGFVHVSPIGSLLQHGVEHAQLFGLLVMASEFAIGFATLLGIAQQLQHLVVLECRSFSGSPPPGQCGHTSSEAIPPTQYYG
jgi:uncharacterized membrane protein YphA (DoxX/SURF4 family)